MHAPDDTVVVVDVVAAVAADVYAGGLMASAGFTAAGAGLLSATGAVLTTDAAASDCFNDRISAVGAGEACTNREGKRHRISLLW